MKIKIKYQLTFTYILVILLTLTLTGVLFLHWLSNFLLLNIENNLRSQVHSLAKMLSGYAWNDRDLSQAAFFFTENFEQKGRFVFKIGDKNGRIIASSQGQSDNLIDEKARGVLLGQSEVKWIEEKNHEKIMHITVPIESWQKIIGFVDISTSLNEIQLLFSMMTRILGLATIWSVIVVSIIGFFIARTVTKPVNEIKNIAVKISRGDFEERIKPVKNPPELGELATTINYMAEQLRILEKVRAEFFSNVSHELRTPLTIIKGFCITLQDDPGSKEEWEHALKTIEEETDRLTRLVNDLLELSRLKNKKIEFRMEKGDLKSLLLQVIDQFKEQSRKCDVRIICQLPEILPQISFDSDKMKQVFINLIDNAIKYTPPKGVVTLQASAEEQKLHIKILDTGAGVPQEDLPFLFERFFRSKKDRDRAGTGLGLPIVKEIIEYHGGEIIVNNLIPHGLEVNLWLPLEK